jgi:hypothetical protein
MSDRKQVLAILCKQTKTIIRHLYIYIYITLFHLICNVLSGSLSDIASQGMLLDVSSSFFWQYTNNKHLILLRLLGLFSQNMFNPGIFLLLFLM